MIFLNTYRLSHVMLNVLKRYLHSAMCTKIPAIFSALVIFAAPLVRATQLETSCAAEAVAILKNKAAEGDFRAQFWLGTQLDIGECGTKDRQRANVLLQASAAQNFPPSVHVLGVMLRRDGKTAEALKYFERSAVLGYQTGFMDMGLTYAFAEPPIQDKALSYAWLTLAIHRESKPPVLKYLVGARNKVINTISGGDLANAKVITGDLASRFISVPVWSDLTVSAPPSVGVVEPKPDDFNVLFATACMKHFFSPDELRKKMTEQRAEVLESGPATFFLGKLPGTAWAITIESAKYVISLRDDKTCSVYARRAEAKSVQRGFVSLVSTAPKPFSATKSDEPFAESNDSRTKTIEYSWVQPDDKPALAFTLITSENINAPNQAMASMALAKKTK
jgi:hypothetical protein